MKSTSSSASNLPPPTSTPNPNSLWSPPVNPPDEDRRVLGRTITAPITHLDHFPAPDNVTTVTITCNEVAALCPVTGQPDLYTVVVDYTPYGHVIESKALKLFLWGYRDRRISCEDLAAELVSEL